MLEVKRIHLYFRTCGNNIARSKQISWKSCSGKNNVKPCTKNCILFTNAFQIHDFHCIYTLYRVYNMTVNYTFRKSGILAKKKCQPLGQSGCEKPIFRWKWPENAPISKSSFKKCGRSGCRHLTLENYNVSHCSEGIL